MKKLVTYGLAGALLSCSTLTAPAENKTNTSSVNTSTTTVRSAPVQPTTRSYAPAQNLQRVLPADPPRVSTSPVNRITPSGTAPMTPNTTSRYDSNRGLHINPVPSPVQRNPSWNPQGDPQIKAAYEKYQRDHGR